MRRGLLEEEDSSPFDGLDMTDPYTGRQVDPSQMAQQGEWDPNQDAAPVEEEIDYSLGTPAEGYPQDDGQGYAQQAYPDQDQDDGQGYAAAPEPQYQAPPPPRRPAPRQIDPALSETEKKFSKYGFYRLLVTNRFFDNSDPVADEVETELNNFIRGRMSALLGGTDGVEAPVGFSSEEATALKALAASMMAQAAAKRTRPTAPAPRPRPPAPEAPTRRPPVPAQQTRPPARPQMAPRPQRPAAPPQPRYQQPQRPPQLRQQPQYQQPRQQYRQEPQQYEQQRRPPPPQRQAPPRDPFQGRIPPHETEVVEDGVKYRYLHLEAHPAEWGPKSEQLMKRLPVGRHIKLPNGITVLRGGPEEWSKIIKKTITNAQKQDRDRVPFPRNMTAVTHEIAATQVDGALVGLARRLG